MTVSFAPKISLHPHHVGADHTPLAAATWTRRTRSQDTENRQARWVYETRLDACHTRDLGIYYISTTRHLGTPGPLVCRQHWCSVEQSRPCPVRARLHGVHLR